MADLFGSLLLGLVQGVTEWLPVSSSGHLVLLQQVLHIEADVAFDIMLHLSTLLVVLLVFRKDAALVGRALIRRDFRSAEGRTGIFLIAATAVSGLAAACFEGYVTFMFSDLMTVGTGMLITGAVLLLSRFRWPSSGLDMRRSVFIGVAQGLAVVPGISRSGMTVSSSIASGLRREDAVKFSFLLSIPAITAAVIYGLGGAAGLAQDPVPLLSGMAVAFFSGYIALKLLIKLILRKKFWLFSIYCFLAGLFIIWSVITGL